jgi:hypothetical protein
MAALTFEANSKDNGVKTCVISGFRREVEENCDVLACYAASSDNFLPTFWDNLLGPIFRVQEFKRIWILYP